MKKIIFTIILAIAANAVLAQPWMMKIKQGTGTTYSGASSVDEITFINTTTTPFVCGDVILYGGETYPTVLIGSQCWFQKNLNIGTRIAGSLDQTDNSTIEKYCYSNNDATCTTYGGLYQWAEAVQYQNGATNTTSPSPPFTGNVQGICPPGWHIPTIVEFETLQTEVSNEGNALKALGQGTGDAAGTNTSGFSVLLAGIRDFNGDFGNLGSHADFWSSTEGNTVASRYFYLIYNSIYPNVSAYSKVGGVSIRCVKD